MENTTNVNDNSPILTATTPEGMENELIAMAYNLVAQRIKDGSATAAETVHFLKMGSTKERYERERVKKELELMEAKKEALESAKYTEEMFNNVVAAIKSYKGIDED